MLSWLSMRQDTRVACIGLALLSSCAKPGGILSPPADRQHVDSVALCKAGHGRARQLAAGARHTCALRCDNKVVCWGSNMFGELGVSDRSLSWDPVIVPNLDDVV